MAQYVLLAVLCTCTATAASSLGDASSTQQSALLELNSANYQLVAEAVASPQRELLVTTVDLAYKHMHEPDRVLEFFRNFAHHLSEVNRLHNTLILSYTTETCALLMGIGISCFVDRAAPQRQDLPEHHRIEAPTFQKYWHASELSRLNYSLLVLDPDISVLQDPFRHHDASYDVEGLSDWNLHSHIPSPQTYLDLGCWIYRRVEAHNDSTDAFDAHAHIRRFYDPTISKDSAVTRHLSPCQSTGLWFTEPRPATLLFLEHMLNWLLTRHPDQWEQAAFNEVIMAHVIGRAHQAPLRYRILPVELFLNVPTFHLRRREQLDVSSAVIVHAGGVSGTEKEKQMQDLGIWHPEHWQPLKGAPFIEMLHQVLGVHLATLPA